MEGVRIKKKLDKKRGAPEEGRGLHFQPIFVLAFLKSASTQALPSKKKNQTPRILEKPGIWISNCFTYSKEAILGIWKKSRKNLEFVKLIDIRTDIARRQEIRGLWGQEVQ